MIKIFDNVLPDNVVNDIEAYFTSCGTEWYLSSGEQHETAPYPEELPRLDSVSEFLQFTHNIYYSDGIYNEQSLEVVKDIVGKFISATGEKLNSPIRIKANLLPKSLDRKDELTFNTPHVDIIGEQHLVLLYYVNDSDGDTVIFNKKYGDDNLEDIQISQTVKQKKGRFLLFDGMQYHSSTSPKENKYRIVINVDVLP